MKYKVNNNKDIAHYIGDLSVDNHDHYATDSRVESFVIKSK